MQIYIAEHSGFCEGVSAAYNQARKFSNIYMLGNLVHNTKVVEKLQRQGLKVVKEIKQIPEGETVLISAHGVPPQVYKKAEERKLKVIDTTCPWVKRAQKLAKKLIADGCQLFIVGDKNHPEVKGLVGWSNNKGIVVSKSGELKRIKMADKIGIIAQTTQAEENFNSIVSALQKKNKGGDSRLLIHNTICGATQKRQKACVGLAKRVDLMIVVGDKKSANTKRLFELSLETGTKTIWAETRADLKKDLFLGKKKIGITAGASTPNWVIDEVYDRINNGF